MSDLLTEAEHRCIQLTAELSNEFVSILADGPSRAGDWAEFAGYLHAIQRMIGAQAAARAYPDRYRLLGGVVPD